MHFVSLKGTNLSRYFTGNLKVNSFPVCLMHWLPFAYHTHIHTLWCKGNFFWLQCFCVPSRGLILLLMDVFMPKNLIDNPVENVKNQKRQWKAGSGDGVNLLGPVDEDLPHFLGALWHYLDSMVGALWEHAILCLQTWPHSISGEAEPTLPHLIFLFIENTRRCFSKEAGHAVQDFRIMA